MSRGRAIARPRRSAVEWTARGLLAAVAALVALASLSASLASAVKRRDPAWAHSLAPWDGRITALLAERALGEGPAPALQKRADQLARLALQQDGTAVPAVVTAGIVAQLQGDLPRARKILGYSQDLSRRNLPTRFWAIEDAISRNDIPEVLRHYDIALRTNRTAPDTLFPLLAGASSDPAIARELAKTLAAKPAWGPNFIDYVAGSGPDSRAVWRLFQRLRVYRVPVSQAAQAVTIARLISHGAATEAWAYYAAMHPGADPRASRDPKFGASTSDPTPFDWITVNDAGITTSIQMGQSGGGVLDFSLPGGLGGVVVRQIQMLPPGEYELRGHSAGIDLSTDARPYWSLSCQDGREAGRVFVPNSSQANGYFAGRLRVSAACPIQTLALTIQPVDSASGVTGQIDLLQLRPAR